MRLEDIKRISVIGAGTMGHGIGLAYALGGYNVVLNDRETALDNALRQMRSDLETFAESGLIPGDSIEEVLSRITPTAKIEEAAGRADFVTEAVVEDVAVKREIFRALNSLCPDHTILTSNTSSLVLGDFAPRCSRRDRTLITHWFNPPPIVPVVEVVKAEATSEEVVDLVYALLRKIKKVPVKIRKEIPGFVVNRIQHAMIREVWSLWEQGIASAEDIDVAVRGSLGFRLATMGPLRICDLGGLDIWCTVAENLFQVISDAHEPSEAIKRMVRNGELGLKSGKGFFDYSVGYFDKGQDKSVKERNTKFIELLKVLSY